MITLGNNKIAKMYLGATPVATSYLGSQQVYPNASLALSADLLAFAAAGGSQELTVAVEEGQMWALSVPVGWSASGRGRNGIADACVLATVDLERRERIGGNDYFRGHGRLFRFRGRCCHRNGVRVHERYDGVGPDDRCDSYGFGVA